MKTWSVKLFGIDFDIRQDDDGVFIIPEGIPGGSALKPAWEPIILCRKPLEGTIVQNTIKHGVGGINIDACRIGQETRTYRGSGAQPSKLSNHDHGDTGIGYMDGGGKDMEFTATGRFPANLVLSHAEGCRCVGMKNVKRDLRDATGEGAGIQDNQHNGGGAWKSSGMSAGSTVETVEAWECVEGCPIRLMDMQSGVRKSGTAVRHNSGGNTFGGENQKPPMDDMGYDDSGGASRFFANFEPDYDPFLYTPKANKRDRDEGCEAMEEKTSFDKNTSKHIAHINHETGETTYSEYVPSSRHNHHPTVKSTKLMSWLCKLITPPGGTCLDPFMGSGSTGKACMLEGFNFIGIEQDAEYCKIAEARIRYAQNNAGKEPEKKKPIPRRPATPQAAEQPAPEKPAPKPSAQVSIFEIDKS